MDRDPNLPLERMSEDDARLARPGYRFIRCVQPSTGETWDLELHEVRDGMAHCRDGEHVFCLEDGLLYCSDELDLKLTPESLLYCNHQHNLHSKWGR